jgi:hypothetical protein
MVMVVVMVVALILLVWCGFVVHQSIDYHHDDHSSTNDHHDDHSSTNDNNGNEHTADEPSCTSVPNPPIGSTPPAARRDFESIAKSITDTCTIVARTVKTLQIRIHSTLFEVSVGHSIAQTLEILEQTLCVERATKHSSASASASPPLPQALFGPNQVLTPSGQAFDMIYDARRALVPGNFIRLAGTLFRIESSLKPTGIVVAMPYHAWHVAATKYFADDCCCCCCTLPRLPAIDAWLQKLNLAKYTHVFYSAAIDDFMSLPFFTRSIINVCLSLVACVCACVCVCVCVCV